MNNYLAIKKFIVTSELYHNGYKWVEYILKKYRLIYTSMIWIPNYGWSEDITFPYNSDVIEDLYTLFSK